MDYSWSEERSAEVEKLWEIANKIGGVTRNAVIGRVRRMKLPYRKGPATARPKRVMHRPTPIRVQVRKAAQTPLRALLKETPALPLPPTTGIKATVSYTDFDRNLHCANIVAEHMPFKADRKIFCGRKPLDGAPYCEDCCKRNYALPAVAKPTVSRTSLAVQQVIRAEAHKHAAVNEFMTETT